MHDDFINIHGPEHHFLDGWVFLTALHNNGLNMNLEENLDKLEKRAITMPGAMCGYWGHVRVGGFYRGSFSYY